MKLSVIIVNYNTRDLLRDCLTSLRKSQLNPEVIVVDNASDDGSADMVREHFPAVTLLAQAENTWFCGGNNIGIRAARGTYVLLLNPDTVVQPHALVTLVNFMDAHPHYDGVTAQLRYPDGRVQRTCSRVPTYEYLLLNHTPLLWLNRTRTKRVNARHWYENVGFRREQSRDVEVMPGSCLLMRRDEILLDEQLRLYFPEDDLARRYPDGLFRFVASAQIIHREKSATRSWLATRVYYRDLLVYTRKHHGLARMLLLWLLSRPLYVGMWLRRFTRHA